MPSGLITAMPDVTERNLWEELKTAGTKNLFYATLVAVIGSVSFGYGNGFSSPALPDLDKTRNDFNKTLDHDLFNVSQFFHTQICLCN